MLEAARTWFLFPVMEWPWPRPSMWFVSWGIAGGKRSGREILHSSGRRTNAGAYECSVGGSQRALRALVEPQDVNPPWRWSMWPLSSGRTMWLILPRRGSEQSSVGDADHRSGPGATCIVLKRSLNPGFAGVDNPLFFKRTRACCLATPKRRSPRWSPSSNSDRREVGCIPSRPIGLHESNLFLTLRAGLIVSALASIGMYRLGSGPTYSDLGR